MDLRRLNLFIAVVDHGTITAAAHAVHVAQPAVSLAIQELETEVGTALFVRTRSGAVLTPAGEALVAPARQALRDIALASQAVAAVTGLVAGRLDLVSLPTLAADPLAAMVGRFRQAHPGVAVRLGAPDEPGELAEAVRRGAAELGITERSADNAGLEQHHVVDQNLVAISPPGTTRRARSISLAALSRLALVVTGRGTSLRTLLEQALVDAELTPIVAVESAQRDALIPLVLAGAGTAVLPETLAATAAGLGAVVRTIRPPLQRHVVLVHRPGGLSPAAARFVELARSD